MACRHMDAQHADETNIVLEASSSTIPGRPDDNEDSRLLELRRLQEEYGGDNLMPQAIETSQTAIATNDPHNRHDTVVEERKTSLKRPVSWRDLPHKQQLIVIVLTRLSEPLVQTSLQSYMFYQLKFFDSSLPDAVIASQAGILHASFTAAQLFTAMLWGRVADSSRFGRKKVILIGLVGTTISCVGFGLSTSFWQALLFRSLGGVTNGNVGVLRTMISELVREKKYQQRAFVLLPMTFNIGVIIGPILGGLLADPASSYPNVLGKVELFRRLPYALPNLVSAFFLSSAAVAAFLCLEEVSNACVFLKLHHSYLTDNHCRHRHLRLAPAQETLASNWAGKSRLSFERG